MKVITFLSILFSFALLFWVTDVSIRHLREKCDEKPSFATKVKLAVRQYLGLSPPSPPPWWRPLCGVTSPCMTENIDFAFNISILTVVVLFIHGQSRIKVKFLTKFRKLRFRASNKKEVRRLNEITFRSIATLPRPQNTGMVADHHPEATLHWICPRPKRQNLVIEYFLVSDWLKSQFPWATVQSTRIQPWNYCLAKCPAIPRIRNNFEPLDVKPRSKSCPDAHAATSRSRPCPDPHAVMTPTRPCLEKRIKPPSRTYTKPHHTKPLSRPYRKPRAAKHRIRPYPKSHVAKSRQCIEPNDVMTPTRPCLEPRIKPPSRTYTKPHHTKPLSRPYRRRRATKHRFRPYPKSHVAKSRPSIEPNDVMTPTRPCPEPRIKPPSRTYTKPHHTKPLSRPYHRPRAAKHRFRPYSKSHVTKPRSKPYPEPNDVKHQSRSSSEPQAAKPRSRPYRVSHATKPRPRPYRVSHAAKHRLRPYPEPHTAKPRPKPYHEQHVTKPRSRPYPEPNDVRPQSRPFPEPNDTRPQSRPWPEPNDVRPQSRPWPEPNDVRPQSRPCSEPQAAKPRSRPHRVSHAAKHRFRPYPESCATKPRSCYKEHIEHIFIPHVPTKEMKIYRGFLLGPVKVLLQYLLSVVQSVSQAHGIPEIHCYYGESVTECPTLIRAQSEAMKVDMTYNPDDGVDLSIHRVTSTEGLLREVSYATYQLTYRGIVCADQGTTLLCGSGWDM